MSKIDRIEADIEITKTDIEITKAELVDAKKTGKSEAYLISLQNTLTEQTALLKNLLINQGKFTLLSLLIALSYPLYLTFLIHMMTYNA